MLKPPLIQSWPLLLHRLYVFISSMQNLKSAIDADHVCPSSAIPCSASWNLKSLLLKPRQLWSLVQGPGEFWVPRGAKLSFNPAAIGSKGKYCARTYMIYKAWVEKIYNQPDAICRFATPQSLPTSSLINDPASSAITQHSFALSAGRSAN